MLALKRLAYFFDIIVETKAANYRQRLLDHLPGPLKGS